MFNVQRFKEEWNKFFIFITFRTRETNKKHRFSSKYTISHYVFQKNVFYYLQNIVQ